MRTQFDFAQGALGYDLSTDLSVRDCTAIVQVAEPLPDLSESEIIDHITRSTYNLLRAALKEGVSRFIFLSTLELMAAYDENFGVNERWRPRPNTDPLILAKHLGEYICREFAREGEIEVVILRLGKPERHHPMWVDPRDAAQAVSRAVSAPLGVWSIFHIISGAPSARFETHSARHALGHEPRLNW